ncbi:RtcB family protein, partial [Candidatus Woesearchaeota archaeon]|nr:RtcB family protein [Candidatus Woesearchaeota archaeon]
LTFGSTAHGAGRLMSRAEAKGRWKGEDIQRELASRGIVLKAQSWRGVAEEAYGAYKDVDEVAKTSNAVGIGKLVARLVPVGVIKG